MGGEESTLDSSQPQKAAGDSTVPIVRFHYIPSVFVFLSLSVHPSDSPSNQVLPLSFSLSLKKMDGQQKAAPSLTRRSNVEKTRRAR